MPSCEGLLQCAPSSARNQRQTRASSLYFPHQCDDLRQIRDKSLRQPSRFVGDVQQLPPWLIVVPWLGLVCHHCAPKVPGAAGRGRFKLVAEGETVPGRDDVGRAGRSLQNFTRRRAVAAVPSVCPHHPKTRRHLPTRSCAYRAYERQGSCDTINAVHRDVVRAGIRHVGELSRRMDGHRGRR